MAFGATTRKTNASATGKLSLVPFPVVCRLFLAGVSDLAGSEGIPLPLRLNHSLSDRWMITTKGRTKQSWLLRARTLTHRRRGRGNGTPRRRRCRRWKRSMLCSFAVSASLLTQAGSSNDAAAPFLN